MWKKASCDVGDCWEAEEGDTLRTLAKQSGVSFGALVWAFGSTVTITPGETAISVAGVQAGFEGHMASLVEEVRKAPLFEPGIGGGIIKRFGPGAARAVGNLIRPTKPVNLPSANKLDVKIGHIVDNHTATGSGYLESIRNPSTKQFKDIFPSHLTPNQIESAVRDAYTHSEIIRTQGTRVVLRGVTRDGTVIEMHFNRATKTIETAYPKSGVN